MRIYIILLLCLFFSCQKGQTIVSLTIQNPSKWERLNEPVTLVLSNYFRGALHLKNYMKLYENDKEVLCQFIGSTNTGKIDKLFFITNFNKNETKSYKLVYHEKQNLSTNYISKESNYLIDYENNNTNNGIDSDYQSINTNYFQKEKLTYFESSTAIITRSLGIKFDHTIYKVKTPTKSNYKLISSGHYKTVFQLNHFNWIQNDRNFNINHHISIDKTTPYCENIVDCTGVQKGDELIIGVSKNIDSLIVMEQNPNYLILVTPDDTLANSNNNFLAYVINKKDFVQIYDKDMPANKNIKTSLIGLKLFNNSPIKFRLYASKFDFTYEQFINLIKNDVKHLNQPLIINLKKD